MTTISIILFSVFDAETMIRNGGLLIICFAVFAQTGLFFCFFVPSGVFLFVGGMFIATGQMDHDLITVCICTVLASVFGCCVSYWFGWKTGPLLYKRKDSRFFRKKYLYAADVFFKKYGRLALTLSMLFPITRTFAPIVAGIVGMDKKKFSFFNMIGCVAWVFSMIIAGHFLQKWILTQFDFDLKKHLEVIVLGIVIVTTAPVLIKLFSNKKKETVSQPPIK